MDAEAPDVLVGVIAQTGAQVPKRAVREIGIVVFAADLLKILLCVHPVQINGVVQIIVQVLEIAGGRHGRQVQHGVVVGPQIQVAVIDPQVAGHGVVDAQAEAVRAVVADHLAPGERAVGLLFAPVHGKALLVGLAGLRVRLVRHHRHIQLAVVLDDIPNAAAV